jgi:cell shape-determining protein MreC
LTEDERRQLKRQIEEAQRRRNEEQQRKHEATAIRAEMGSQPRRYVDRRRTPPA